MKGIKVFQANNSIVVPIVTLHSTSQNNNAQNKYEKNSIVYQCKVFK
jgi:hypothetical protein